MIEASAPACADHPGATVTGWGRDPKSRRRRWKCLGGASPHAPSHGKREDLLGLCLSCDRHWEHGYPTATGAWFHLDQVVAFLASVAGGTAIGPSMRLARAARHKVLTKRARIAGVPAPVFPPPTTLRHWHIPRLNLTSVTLARPEEDGRTGADWLGRYGAPFVAATLDRSWPSVPVLVDSTKFQSSKAVYPAGHARAGQPKRGGTTAFVVMAAGVRVPGKPFRVIHVRAVPDESQTSWEIFFRSLPGQPAAILADQWPHIVRAANAVWPGIPIKHSAWHAWDFIRRAFNRAHWYPGTHQLVLDGPAAFADHASFLTWRDRAEANAPPTVQKWLKKYGDAHEQRLAGLGPYSTGPVEAFLRGVRGALIIGQGRIKNMPRLDIRLGLMATRINRQADEEDMRAKLLDLLGTHRLAYRELDSSPFEPVWGLAGFP